MKGTIYKYTFSDGKVYIGKSIRAGQRMKEHFDKNSGPSNPGFYEAYQRLGEPTYEVLFEEDFSNILDLQVRLCAVESYYIGIYNATNPECGYNKRFVSSFSPGSKRKIEDKVAELTRELLFERLKEYNSIKNKLWLTKEKLSPEELYFIKDKYREYNIFQKQIDNFDFDDYSNNTDYDLEFLLDEGLNYIKCIIESDTEKDVRSYVYSNADIVFNENNEKDILKINDLGEIVKEYHTINEISEDLNIRQPDNIRNVLRGVQKTAYGYYWMYRKDYEKEE